MAASKAFDAFMPRVLILLMILFGLFGLVRLNSEVLYSRPRMPPPISCGRCKRPGSGCRASVISVGRTNCPVRPTLIGPPWPQYAGPLIGSIATIFAMIRRKPDADVWAGFKNALIGRAIAQPFKPVKTLRVPIWAGFLRKYNEPSAREVESENYAYRYGLRQRRTETHGDEKTGAIQIDECDQHNNTQVH